MFYEYGQNRNAHKSSVRTPEVREAFAKCGHTRENIIQLVLTEKEWDGMDSFERRQDPVSLQC